MFITKLSFALLRFSYIGLILESLSYIQFPRNCYSILSVYPPISIRLFRTFMLFKKSLRLGGGWGEKYV